MSYVIISQEALHFSSKLTDPVVISYQYPSIFKALLGPPTFWEFTTITLRSQTLINVSNISFVFL